ncbi:tryptophan--tRNA ligase [Candidatus Peregrinibacteria bacterium]|jgi:tryptophanyl-tRNA synthetase|nr:tryptophan--tRNA ligase [Candidatus Peregrinibacteria bacterium]MBT3598571.1 tryptophan--tRNA ligase [Candidatus Peregrinibacteria bacterium]MBT4585280.1 tryptophan--tRNA ligase [Candidatus Peregrinibacteria bacterium]MBT6730566.1 tryptophan--tRNA ligase [Candidatus Peregrinibacteria bacterium]MBT7009452.1 tryptophan--tRNA ligase [Candidatus Peregrinibacteria bacterium]
MRVLSGMQPSGDAHLGNYLGSIKPNIDLLGEDENLYMIADLHALTSVHDADELNRFRWDLAKDILACGFDPNKGILFFQSDIPYHTELSWILSCITPMGLLERAVSYKEKVEKGLSASAGLFTYPVLQAADILLYDTDIVPVGKDQKQHIEITRDIAQKINNQYAEGTLVVPDVRIRKDVAVIPGTDGQKMSKSYGNTIPLFADESVIKKAIMGITTDSKSVEEPKNPEECIVYQMHAPLLSDKEQKDLADQYKAGGLGYGDAKNKLLETFMDTFSSMRKKRDSLSDSDVKEILDSGSVSASSIAEVTMDRVKKAVGLR